MAAGDDVSEDEKVVRALYEPLWSPAHQRPTSRAFTQIDASVSRLAVLAYDDIVRQFVSERPAGRAPVVATSTVLVRDILAAVKANPMDGADTRVVEDPIPENTAHAEIRTRRRSDGAAVELTKPIAGAILKAAVLRTVPES